MEWCVGFCRICPFTILVSSQPIHPLQRAGSEVFSPIRALCLRPITTNKPHIQFTKMNTQKENTNAPAQRIEHREGEGSEGLHHLVARIWPAVAQPTVRLDLQPVLPDERAQVVESLHENAAHLVESYTQYIDCPK
ncbi:hypothetical protein BHE74_00035225 [Ensete ventricosum]|nr:hypothetical protein BHE74_00035225 [Ensete ventricosum]